MEASDPIVIVSAARTPMGSFQGAFSRHTAPELGAMAIKTAVERSNIDPTEISEIMMGCVLQAGMGQAPARQASLKAGLPKSVGCTTVNKVCGSGLQAVIVAHDSLIAGSHTIVVAGGMESMTNAPYILQKARSGYRIGHGEIKDALFFDGLEDAYEVGNLMGVFAERTADKYNIGRKAQDAFALCSLFRAQHATKQKWFLSDVEMIELEFLKQDEQLLNAKPEKIPLLKPVFKKDGTVTAANSSSISDGAAALVLMRLSEAKRRNLKPKAKILGHAGFATDPSWFTIAPVGAIQTLLKKLNWTTETADLYEINEAFAVVTLAVMQELNLPLEKVNIHGGACALGHPLGATGARFLCTLLGALQQTNQKRGIAALCLGGGEAIAVAIERIDT